MPKNIFKILVNDAEYYSLVKEEVDYDPSKTETLTVESVKINDKETISGSIPWIIDDVEEKIQTALGIGHLKSLYASGLESKSWVANEFLDVLYCYDLPENGLDKFIFSGFKKECEQFEEEVLTRLANMCFQI